MRYRIGTKVQLKRSTSGRPKGQWGYIKEAKPEKDLYKVQFPFGLGHRWVSSGEIRKYKPPKVKRSKK